MVGITSYGAYVPLWRLKKEAIAKGARGEKPICNFDEDTITMSVAAAIDCLKGLDREAVDGLLFATTNSPYLEKQGASIVAAGVDLRRNIFTADLCDSLKSGTAALKVATDMVKAGSAQQVLVTAADRRQGAPLSPIDRSSGDGAAALLVGDSKVIATLEASYSVSDEIMDMWRNHADTFVRQSNERFGEVNGYVPVITQVISGLLKENNLAAKDFAKLVIYAPNARRAAEIARATGFDPKVQLQDTLDNVMGNTGAAYSLMLFVAALEEAKAGDLILLASYGDGADAFAFRVTKEIAQLRKNTSRKGFKKHLASKRLIDDYKTYWLWRGLLNPAVEAGPLPDHYWKTSPMALWRERNRILRLHGVKCKTCGTVQYPPQRVCSKCHTKDNFEEVRLSDKRGTVSSVAMDTMASEVDSPVVCPIISLEGGGTFICYMTDRVVEEVKVGMEIEMSFRKVMVREGINNYFWKAIPIRA